jgi:hypothetical protein
VAKQHIPDPRVPILDVFETRARAGDSGYAIAYALLELAGRTASGLNQLGTSNAGSPMGAIEYLGLEVKRVADAIESLAERFPR